MNWVAGRVGDRQTPTRSDVDNGRKRAQTDAQDANIPAATLLAISKAFFDGLPIQQALVPVCHRLRLGRLARDPSRRVLVKRRPWKKVAGMTSGQPFQHGTGLWLNRARLTESHNLEFPPLR